MKNSEDLLEGGPLLSSEPTGVDLLRPLVDTPLNLNQGGSHPGVVVGELVGMAEGGRAPLVSYPGQSRSAAVLARTTVDLQDHHIGSRVVLMFEDNELTKPIVTGVLREQRGWPLPEAPAQVDVDCDGERLVVSARSQIVLRCGKASITLTREGKVLIRGSYVLSRSSGVNRIKGGAVQIN